ncbi:hypothetical protein L545_0947 [Bordetella pertussis STO1-CHLA-0011]|nr:hypothetical protein L545_0947 [Bordetella pertussis STO1-CHLA-0011]
MHQPVLPAFLIARWLLLLVLLAGIYFLSGFLVPALAALIIGLATWPLFQRLVRAFGGRTTLAATLALVAVIVILVVPLSLALSYAIKEAGNFFALGAGGQQARRGRAGLDHVAAHGGRAPGRVLAHLPG